MCHGLLKFTSGPPPKVGLMQILGDHLNGTSFGYKSRTLTTTRSQSLAHVQSGPQAWELNLMGREWVMFRSIYRRCQWMVSELVGVTNPLVSLLRKHYCCFYFFIFPFHFFVVNRILHPRFNCILYNPLPRQLFLGKLRMTLS